MSCFEVRGWKGAVTRLSGLNTKANQASVKTAGACRDIKRAMYLSRRAGLPPPAFFPGVGEAPTFNACLQGSRQSQAPQSRGGPS